jgi:hypothetical protein
LIIRWTDYRRSSALIGGRKILLWSIQHQRPPSQRLKCNSPALQAPDIGGNVITL